MLYKGGALERLESVFREDESLDFFALASNPPTDFSFFDKGLYLTMQAELAWKYAQWAARAVDGMVVPVGMIQVAIPKPLLASTFELVGEDWTKYVWTARHNAESPPSNMADIRDSQWIVGPLCKQGQDQTRKMKAPSELMFWRLENGQVAYQIFTSNHSLLRLLAEHCVGKVWVTSLALK